MKTYWFVNFCIFFTVLMVSHELWAFLLSNADKNKDALIHVLQRDNEMLEVTVAQLESRLQSIQQEMDKLIDGLQLYTDGYMYCPNCGRLHTDNGDTARRILKDIGVGEERT